MIEKLLSLQYQTNKEKADMKYKEFHLRIKKAGWKYHHAEGSHYFYEKDGRLSQPVPYHGAKEIPEPLRKKIARELGL